MKMIAGLLENERKESGGYTGSAMQLFKAIA